LENVMADQYAIHPLISSVLPKRQSGRSSGWASAARVPRCAIDSAARPIWIAPEPSARDHDLWRDENWLASHRGSTQQKSLRRWLVILGSPKDVPVTTFHHR
jgi:hypothetical protein